MLLENSSLENISRIKALMTTLAAAAANPCRKRIPISISIESDNAQALDANAKTITPPRITGLRPRLSAIGP